MRKFGKLYNKRDIHDSTRGFERKGIEIHPIREERCKRGVGRIHGKRGRGERDVNRKEEW